MSPVHGKAPVYICLQDIQSFLNKVWNSCCILLLTTGYQMLPVLSPGRSKAPRPRNQRAAEGTHFCSLFLADLADLAVGKYPLVI